MGQNKPPHSVEGMGSLPHPVRCSGGGVIYSLKKKKHSVFYSCGCSTYEREKKVKKKTNVV